MRSRNLLARLDTRIYMFTALAVLAGCSTEVRRTTPDDPSDRGDVRIARVRMPDQSAFARFGDAFVSEGRRHVAVIDNLGELRFGRRGDPIRLNTTSIR